VKGTTENQENMTAKPSQKKKIMIHTHQVSLKASHSPQDLNQRQS
jgi:hypothetical protein